MIYIITAGNDFDFGIIGVIAARNDTEACKKIKKMKSQIVLEDGFTAKKLNKISKNYRTIWLG